MDGVVTIIFLFNNCSVFVFLKQTNCIGLIFAFNIFGFIFNVCWQINFFTTEAALFVRHLKFFSNIENIQINQQIAELLRIALCDIQQLFNKVEIVETPNQSIVDLIFDFDERVYSLRRYLECQSCCVSEFGLIVI